MSGVRIVRDCAASSSGAQWAIRFLLAIGVLLLLGSSFAFAPGSAAAPVEIVVTTSADASNGDISSVAALKANPGPDGISLREAIETTDNEPGAYDIRFAPSLSGATIVVGGTCCGSLPPLSGGGVSIDGDINGDGRPDVTLVAGPDGASSFGFDVVSSDNRLQGLALQGFVNGVVVTGAPYGGALPTGRAFAGNVVSGLVVTGASSGIRIQPTGPDPGHPECVVSACQTHNRWTDTQLVDNTIETSGRGGIGAIDVALQEVAGDAVQGLTVDGNTIRLAQPGNAISFTAGGGAHADANVLADVLVAHNTVDAPAPAIGINVWSGFRGGSGNVVEGMRIVDNTIRFTGAPPVGSEADGISFAISDDCYPVGCPPGAVFPNDNAVRSFQIIGNAIEGAETGIVVSDLCCGGPTGSRLTDGRIAGNTIESTLSPHDHAPLGIAIGGGAAVSNVVVSGNTVVQRAPGRASDYAAYLAGGAIGVLGGLGKTGGSIRNVTITRNRLDTPLAGITIVGGGPSDEAPNADASGNHVSGVYLSQNRILQAPSLASRWNGRVRGINVIGGLSGLPLPSGHRPGSTLNSVKCVRLKGNIVVGQRDAVSIFANLGPQASSNTARLGGC